MSDNEDAMSTAEYVFTLVGRRDLVLALILVVLLLLDVDGFLRLCLGLGFRRLLFRLLGSWACA